MVENLSVIIEGFLFSQHIICLISATVCGFESIGLIMRSKNITELRMSSYISFLFFVSKDLSSEQPKSISWVEPKLYYKKTNGT